MSSQPRKITNQCFKLSTSHVWNDCTLHNTEGISDHSLKRDSKLLDSLQINFSQLKDESKLKLILTTPKV